MRFFAPSPDGGGMVLQNIYKAAFSSPPLMGVMVLAASEKTKDRKFPQSCFLVTKNHETPKHSKHEVRKLSLLCLEGHW